MPGSGFVRVDREALWVVRFRARLPRLVLAAGVLVLCLVGVRSLLASPVVPPARPARAAFSAVAVEGFAQRFARAYLSPDDRRRERARQLAALTSASVDLGGAALTRSPRQVQWTVVAGTQRTGPRRMIVVVEAPVAGGVVDLAVPVAWNAEGRMVVPTAPALVGPPLTATTSPGELERDVEDSQLRAASERVVRNYLAGDRQDLQADLAPGARLSLPPQRLRVRGVQEVTWASPSRVAVTVDAAQQGGGVAALRYELAVLRSGGRWLVKSVVVDPTVGGAGGDG